MVVKEKTGLFAMDVHETGSSKRRRGRGDSVFPEKASLAKREK